MSPHHLCSLLIACCTLLSCGSSNDIQQEAFNPMPTIWDNIKGSIDQLEKRKAPPTDWAQAADKAESVTGQRQLMLILKPVNINSAEMSSLSQRLRSSAEVHHYGFEGNFNALVFFNQQQEPEHVVRW